MIACNEPSSNVLRCPGIYRTIDSSVLENSYYKSEGNTYMVIALQNEGKVLRLKKSDEKNGDKPAEDGGLSRVELAVNFYRNTMSKLMEPFSSEPEIAICDVDDLKEYLKRYEPHRPDNRRHKSVIENFGTILPDYTLLRSELLEKIPCSPSWPIYCLEIKPKEPQDPHLPSMSDLCPYCNPRQDPNCIMLPRFCPECLFSGEKVRTSVSIAEMIKERSKRCKIFKNGHLIRNGEIDVTSSINEASDELGSLDWLLSSKIFVNIVTEALLRAFRPPSSCEYEKLYEEQHSIGRCSPPRGGKLPEGSVLETINRFQNLFRADVRSVYQEYAKQSSTLDDQTVYCLDEFHEDASSELIPLKHYLIYRIIRDCSILVTFQQIDTPMDVPPQNHFESCDRHFASNVAVTDLDPKSIHCIEKHYRQAR